MRLNIPGPQCGMFGSGKDNESNHGTLSRKLSATLLLCRALSHPAPLPLTLFLLKRFLVYSCVGSLDLSLRLTYSEENRWDTIRFFSTSRGGRAWSSAGAEWPSARWKNCLK